MRDGIRTAAAELMSAPVRSIKIDWSLGRAVRFFLKRGFSGAPVVDDSGKPVGVISLKDIARYTGWHLKHEEAEAAPERDETLGREFPYGRLSDVTVRQVMSPGVRTVGEATPLRAVLDLILKERIHRVFVTNRAGRLVGVISTTDIIRWLRAPARGERSHAS